MQAKIVGIFLLGTSLVQGDIAVSNSINSPHRKLSDLTEDVSVLKQEIKTIQEVKVNFDEALKKISDNATQQLADYEQLKNRNEALTSELTKLKSENENLKSEVGNLKKLCENLTEQQNLQITQDINTKIDELDKNLSSVKNTTDGLTLSRQNIEKYLQELYAEVTDKFNRFAQEDEQKQFSTDELKEINQKIENFLGKYQKLDAFNDILVSFQDDLSQLKDSNFSLNVSHEKLEKDFQTLSNQTNGQIKNIEQNKVEADAYKAEAEKKQLNEFKKELVDKCKNICKKTLTQTNEQLQTLAQQVQTKIDNLKSRTFSKHIILSGESLSSIAKRYSTSPEQILITNNIQSARDLRVGDTIIVPNNL